MLIFSAPVTLHYYAEKMSPDMHPEARASAPGSEDVYADKKSILKATEQPIDVQQGLIIEDGLKRGLLSRHVSLISLASVIGASCFYGFGYALYLSGPLGALIGFSVVGELCCGV